MREFSVRFFRMRLLSSPHNGRGLHCAVSALWACVEFTPTIRIVHFVELDGNINGPTSMDRCYKWQHYL